MRSLPIEENLKRQISATIQESGKMRLMLLLLTQAALAIFLFGDVIANLMYRAEHYIHEYVRIGVIILCSINVIWFFASSIAMCCTFYNCVTCLKIHFYFSLTIVAMHSTKLIILLIDSNISTIITSLFINTVNGFTIYYENKFISYLERCLRSL
ncbi:unnamed protein product [Caenorhabditis bovis]|uniref:Uncharacterized protein n=1 Tax=Caenorhabditis bovis TaxID=2654633 RepID=A0A8S1FDH8_9PELO|nr:unnamed protein product [Caenorhabditis bovis]